jgi:PAS domain S-box-containing protein
VPDLPKMPSAGAPVPPRPLFLEEGALFAQAAALNWAATPLGPPDHWPEALRVLTGVMLGSRQPMFIAWGPERIMLYNDGYAPMLGQRHPAALGSRFGDVWADILDTVGPIMDAAYAGRGTHMDDIAITMHRHGYPEETHFAFSYTPVRDEGGIVRGMFCACTETTEQVMAARARQQAEAALQELALTLEQRVAERTAERDRLWRLSPDIMMVARLDGGVLAVNPAFHALLGWSSIAEAGGSLLDMVHPDDQPGTAAAMGRLAEGEPVNHFRNRYRAAGGHWCWLDWSAKAEAGYLHAIGRDISAQVRAEEELARAQEQLRQAQKMEAVGQLTGGLAHDFNNLLTGITGSLELMRTRIARNETGDLSRFIGMALEAAQRAAALTNRLLSFSRRQTLDPRPTDVARLVASLQELIRGTIGPTIALDVESRPGLWLTLCDANQLENALLNLAINARDAMPGGGSLRMGVDNVRLGNSAARAHELPPGDYVRVSVADAGTGMAPEVAERAFEPFYTTKPMGAGTGLGLSMVYGFARQSGGHAFISSRLGEGTTIRLYLPRALLEPVPPEEEVPPPPGPDPAAA